MFAEASRRAGRTIDRVVTIMDAAGLTFSSLTGFAQRVRAHACCGWLCAALVSSGLITIVCGVIVVGAAGLAFSSLTGFAQRVSRAGRWQAACPRPEALLQAAQLISPAGARLTPQQPQGSADSRNSPRSAPQLFRALTAMDSDNYPGECPPPPAFLPRRMFNN